MKRARAPPADGRFPKPLTQTGVKIRKIQSGEPIDTVITKKIEHIMEKLFEILEKDFRKENFTKKELVVYGIIVPVVLVLIMGLAGWLESLV